MSDPELATKAPESDAMEQPSTTQPSAISNTDSPAQSGPSMGEHCTTDRPLLNTNQQSTGTITTLSSQNISAYISKPADYPSTPAKLLLLLTGGTGIESINNQLQADRFASEGFLVCMPDQFGGDAAPNSTNKVTSPTAEAQSPSIIEQVKMRVAETAKSFSIDMWLARQTPEKVLPRLHAVLEAIKDEYADAVAHGGGIYAAGYCFGAKYVLILGGDQTSSQTSTGDEESGAAVEKEAMIKVGGIAHATLVTREDLKGVKVPISMVVVENDQLFPEDVLNEGRKFFASSNIEHEIKVYEGVPHGFAVMGEYQDADIQRKQEEAFEQMLAWLNGH